MTSSFIMEYKTDIIANYRAQKKAADDALARVNDQQFFTLLVEHGDEHTNSIAILVKHIGGNLRSRWQDFLTSDGEKPDRHRESEFQHLDDDSRAAIIQKWELGWQTLFDALESLREADFARTITIRGEPHTIIQAIHRNLLHAAQHVGQIDLLATALPNRT
jgi:hypothetical protein